jgi:diadenosine tetraphosphate (Ap4A) HIT family hydrolase
VCTNGKRWSTVRQHLPNRCQRSQCDNAYRELAATSWYVIDTDSDPACFDRPGHIRVLPDQPEEASLPENRACVYCLDDAGADEPIGGWIYRDQHWLVGHGPSDTTMAGALKITSRRHYVDFADMTAPEAASFGPLLTNLDAALRTVTSAERVHVVSTRDRIQHFHAWLYPRPADHPLRGTAFLDAPQHSNPDAARHAAHALREYLHSQPPLTTQG